jgi:cell division septation protein DedD
MYLMTTLMNKSADESDIGPMLVQRRLCLGFCATVLVGVLLCAAYLVGRVSTGAKTATLSAKADGASSSERNPQLKLRAPAPATQVQFLKTSPAATESQPTAFVSRPGSHLPGDTYLQIAAVDRGMSEVLVELLRRKGFQAQIAVGATEDIFRVMVGPAKDAAELTRIKTDLQAAGFTSFARKAPKLIANQQGNPASRQE